MKIARAWSSTSRRDFVALSTKAVAGAFCTNLIGLTDKAMGVESSQSVINKVRQSHNNFSTFPKHPLSIAWAPHVTSYPLNTEFPYEQDKSNVYPVVEEALMLLGLGDIENPLSAIIDVGDKVVIKPNLCSITYYPDPVTHPSILVPIVDYAIKAGASTVIIADSPKPETCSVCHLPRFMEWNASEHVQAKVKCETCHDEGHSADVLRARKCELCHTSDLVFLAQKTNFALWEPHNLSLTERAQSMKQIGFRLLAVSILLLAVYGVFKKYRKRKSEV